MTIKDAAIKLTGQGFEVFPCHGITDGLCTCGDTHAADLKKVGKHPATPNGHKNATRGFDEVENWWNANPNYNIGTFCKPSGFFVLDIDPRSGGDESFEKLLELLEYDFPETVEAFSGVYTYKGKQTRGRHFYFKYTGEEKLIGNFKRQDLAGIDIKHDGYVMTPPSAHASGVNYEWREGHAPWEIEMAEVPESLLTELQTNSVSRTETGPMAATEMTAVINAATESTEWGAAAVLSELEGLRNTPEGGRNNALFSAGCRIAELIAGGQVVGDKTVELLVVTAVGLGLPESEIQEVLFRPDGAISRGLQNPRKPDELTVDDDLMEFASRMNSTDRPSFLASGSSALNRARIIYWETLFTSAE